MQITWIKNIKISQQRHSILHSHLIASVRILNATRRRLEEHGAAHQGCFNSTLAMKNIDIFRTTVIEKDDDALARARAQYRHCQNSAMQLKVMQLNKRYGGD